MKCDSNTIFRQMRSPQFKVRNGNFSFISDGNIIAESAVKSFARNVAIFSFPGSSSDARVICTCIWPSDSVTNYPNLMVAKLCILAINSTKNFTWSA